MEALWSDQQFSKLPEVLKETRSQVSTEVQKYEGMAFPFPFPTYQQRK